MPTKSWDVFVSHASEDKASVAQPLAELLRRSGARVWLDIHELKVGDSLSEKIDEGLSDSHFGVVILSPSFFSKHWPRRELAGLRSREENDQKVILPVWHNVDKDAVRQFSPILSDGIASRTDSGLYDVAHDILRVVFSATSPASQDQSITRRLAALLDSNIDRNQLVEFLRANSGITGFPAKPGYGAIIWDITLGDCPFDAATISVGHGLHVRYFYFSEIFSNPYEDSLKPRISDSIVDKLEEMQSAQKRLFTTDAAPIELKNSLIERMRHERHCLPFKERELEYYVDGYVRVACWLFCSRRHLIDKDAMHHDLWSDLRRKFKDQMLATAQARPQRLAVPSRASLDGHFQMDFGSSDGIDVHSYDHILDLYQRVAAVG